MKTRSFICKGVNRVRDFFVIFVNVSLDQSCTLVLRGASKHILEEAERSVHDALCVLVTTIQNHKTTYGGGHAEMVMAHACDERSNSIKGKHALAIQAFARALR